MASESMNQLRALLRQTECVYLHDETGAMIAMALPAGGWWLQRLPEAPPDHFGHEHVHPWGDPDDKTVELHYDVPRLLDAYEDQRDALWRIALLIERGDENVLAEIEKCVTEALAETPRS